MKLSARIITHHAVLIAVSLVLSLLDAKFPIPVPGVKLGLANVVTLFSIYTLSPISAASILFCRCILASIFGGGVSSLLFSLCGGACAFCIMLIFKRFRFLTIYGVSIAGAAAHGVGQIIIACFLFSSFAAVSYLPFLLFAAPLTGAVCAFISDILISRLGNMFKN